MESHPAVSYGGEVTIMNAKTKFSHQKLMAMAVVAMFAMCAFSVCLVADSDAGPYGGIDPVQDSGKEQVYNVDISVDQWFTYQNIKTTLDGVKDGEGNGTLTLEGSLNTNNKEGFSFENLTSDRIVSGKFTSPGSYTMVLTAKWTRDNGHGGTLEQTATQTFNFTVYDKITIEESTANGYIVDADPITEKNNVVLTYTGPTSLTTPALNIQPTLDTHENKFQATLSDGKITISPIDPISYIKDGNNTYQFTVTMENSKTGDKGSCEVTYNVYEDIAITNGNLTWYTYETGPDTEDFVFEINYEDADPISVYDSSTINFNPEYGALSPDSAEGDKQKTVKIDVSSKDLVADDGISSEYLATIVAKGHLQNATDPAASPTTTSAEATFKLVVYQFLEFMYAPTVDAISAEPLTASGSALTLSSYITAAKTVSINWGDGTQTGSLSAAGASVSNTYSAYHQYSKSGFYTITITATNDMGTTTSQVLYNAGEGNIEIPTDPEDPSDDSGKSFFDKHGYQFLIFAILAILLLVAFFFFGIQNPMVIILAVIMIVLAVLCYVCNDIGGIVEAIKGLLGKA